MRRDSLARRPAAMRFTQEWAVVVVRALLLALAVDEADGSVHASTLVIAFGLVLEHVSLPMPVRAPPGGGRGREGRPPGSGRVVGRWWG